MLSPVNRFGGDRHSRIVRSIRGGAAHIVAARTIKARAPRAGMASMEDEYLHAASMQAIKRPEVPADLVGTVSFLTSDDAAFMTGAPAGVLAFSFLSDIASPGPRKSAPRSPDALQPWAGP